MAITTSDHAAILAELTSLGLHYRRPTRLPEEQAIWLRDYLGDLGGYSAAAIAEACTTWRRSPANRFPTSGELLGLVRQIAGRESEAMRAWEPITDAEYDRLSLSDKIRHHTILANRAECAAGPQRKAPADMPEAWHTNRARAANHHAEASRLRALMLGSERRAA